ncbi:hypothetical protein H4582DRAFT_1940805 [Lactarius indigo]|nr:hypothetical protein H4582DRAFT_1940805 [Lactarius indigo]
MGRRKIAIQPITNDRTRSVTFLKRKTGLFKKAYELGVLCSVDVAVIIFERKPGHPDKLFQYCSTDIDSLVQRQIRFDGERDLRTPHDFTGGASLSRLDDMGDDDDDADADDSPTASYMRHDSLKGKSIPDSGKSSGAKPKTTSEMDYRPHLHLPGTVPTSSPTLPVSADRHTQPTGNRVGSSSSPYAAPSPNPRKRAKMDDHSSSAPSPISGAFPTHPHHSGPPPPPQQQQHQQHAHAYQSGFFPGFSSHDVSPTLPHGSALHTPASFPSPGGGVSSGSGPGGGGGGGPPLHLLQTAAAAASVYGPSPRHHPPRITQPHFGPTTEDLFASVFGGPAGASGFAPTTHAGGAGGNQHHPQTTGGGGTGGGAGGDSSSSSSWLDFLSGAADAPRSPRLGKRSRGDGLGSGGGGGSEDGAHGPGRSG